MIISTSRVRVSSCTYNIWIKVQWNCCYYFRLDVLGIYLCQLIVNSLKGAIVLILVPRLDS